MVFEYQHNCRPQQKNQVQVREGGREGGKKGRTSVNLEHVQAARLVGQRNLNLSIQPPRPQEGRIEDIRSVGGHHHLDSTQLVKPIQLI